ncbi:hypothetical protein HFP15_37785 [Amycolatopsis sp. K13G38]|uniref:DUF1990 domain-containing protein n=1 Tax=Amycolatopsis acididurans TaxID=2724524 RepID=A0ABX1JK34_9PSEU|nr:hypothetical protein [Amycolatopsis acididurans]NKQ58612.1 hypothetical protein [Amycolatopsis acididurans]
MSAEPVAPTLLDEFTPRFEFSLQEHALVSVGPARAEKMLRRLNVSPVRLLDGVYPVPMRPRPSTPGFDELLVNGRWTVLGYRVGESVVFGAAGRFWTVFSDWQPITPAQFVSYSRPRRGTIAVAISHLPCGPRQTLLTFEARATTTDEVAHRWADWYWHSVRPTAHLVIREVLRRASA